MVLACIEYANKLLGWCLTTLVRKHLRTWEEETPKPGHVLVLLVLVSKQRELLLKNSGAVSVGTYSTKCYYLPSR